MIRVSDIMEKEIINVKNGKRMGFITDIDMDINEGKVISFSISGDSGRSDRRQLFQERRKRHGGSRRRKGQKTNRQQIAYGRQNMYHHRSLRRDRLADR